MGKTACRHDRHHATRRLAVALLAALVAATATAEDLPPAGLVPGGSEIEIIVFRLLDQHANTPEVGRPTLAMEASRAFSDAGDAGAGPTAVGDTGYPALAPPALRLGGIAARLRKSTQYELLYHSGWVQDVMSQSQATPTPLPADARLSGLQGSLTLYRERYLHVVVDVQLDNADRALQPWRIRQKRRLRGQAAQYFDHPRFGVILAVRAGGGATTEAKP